MVLCTFFCVQADSAEWQDAARQAQVVQQLPFPQGMQTFHAVATLQQEQHPLYSQHTCWIQQSVGERTVAHPQLPPRHQRHLQQHMRPDDPMIDFTVSPMAALPVNCTPMHQHEAVVSQPQLQNAVEMDAHVQSTQRYSMRHRQLHGPVPDQRMYAQRMVPAGLDAPPACAVPSPVGMMNATRIPEEVHAPVTTELTLPFPTATDWSTQSPPHGTAEAGHQQHGAGSTHAEDALISFDFENVRTDIDSGAAFANPHQNAYSHHQATGDHADQATVDSKHHTKHVDAMRGNPRAQLVTLATAGLANVEPYHHAAPETHVPHADVRHTIPLAEGCACAPRTADTDDMGDPTMIRHNGSWQEWLLRLGAKERNHISRKCLRTSVCVFTCARCIERAAGVCARAMVALQRSCALANAWLLSF